MQRNIIIYLHLLFLFSSCKPGIDYLTLSRLVEESDKCKVIYVSDIGCEDSLYRQFMQLHEEYNREYEFYRFDCGLRENMHLLYAYNIESLPAIIIITPNGICDTKDDSVSLEDWEVVTVNNGGVGNDLLHLYCAIESGNENRAYELRSKLDTENSFYYHYLLYKYAVVFCKNDAITYLRKAIQTFIESPKNNQTMLFQELAHMIPAESPIVVFDSLHIDVGSINHYNESSYVFHYKNYSEVPFIILQSVVSCPCLTINFPKITDPYEDGDIEVSYKPDKTPDSGTFLREIHLITNSSESPIILTLSGKY